MNIVGGKYRGKKLNTPKDMSVRPTLERTREALFNILYSKIGDIKDFDVADIFAGTGAFGLEALSRGAKSVTFADKDIALIAKNAALFTAEKEKIKIIKTDATNLPLSLKPFDLVFCDAPYEKGLTLPAVESLVQKKWLKDGALCLIETGKSETLNLPEAFEQIDERIYGAAKIRFFIFHTYF